MTHPPQNDGPLIFFAKLNGNQILMANSSSLRKYKTFGLIELHNLSKGWLADRIFKLWKSCVCDYRVVEYIFWNSDILIFATFKQLLSFFLRKYLQVSKIDFESTDKVLPLHQYLWSEISWQWNNGPLKLFLKFAQKSLLLLKYCQIREIIKTQFCRYF